MDAGEPIPARERDALERMGRALDRIDAALLQLGRQGVANLSRSSVDELGALERTAHNGSLVHVERALASLGTFARRYLDRDPLFSSRAWAYELCRTSLLCRRARGALVPGVRLAQIRPITGIARRTYTPIEGELDVQTLAAVGWVTDSGYVGLTLHLWDDAGERLLQATVARPSAAFGTDPRTLWRQSVSEVDPLTPERLAREPMVLGGVKLSEDGRVSLHRDLMARPGTPRGVAAYRAFAVADGAALLDRLEEVAADPLAPRASALVFLRPAALGPLHIDEIRGVARAELTDRTGGALQLEVALRPEHNTLVDNLQVALGEGIRPAGLFGRAWVAGGRLRLLPWTARYLQGVRVRVGRRSRTTTTVHLTVETLETP